MQQFNVQITFCFPIAISLIFESRDYVHAVSDFSYLILQCQECSSLEDRLGQMAKDSSATKYFGVPSYVQNCLESSTGRKIAIQSSD